MVAFIESPAMFGVFFLNLKQIIFMKNEMSLDVYGVQTLSFEEEKEIDGGGFWGLPILIIAHVLWEVATNPSVHKDAELAGFHRTCGCK